ncbi:MAG: nitrilase-related carbon-nitrogen hydrolase [Alphaproteobacteria bacterium]
MKFSVGLAQCSPVSGDLAANLDLVERIAGEARARGADLVVFPEMMLSGSDMNRAVGTALALDDPAFDRLAALSREVSLCVGFIERTADFRHFIAAAYLENGRLAHVQRKIHVVSHGSYDEGKLCGPAREVRAFDSRFGRMAIAICEDAWHYGYMLCAALDGATVILTPIASAAAGVFAVGESAALWEVSNRSNALRLTSWVVCVNRVGVVGERDYWGGSQLVTPFGEVALRGDDSAEDLYLGEIDIEAARRARFEYPALQIERVRDLVANLKAIDRERL